MIFTRRVGSKKCIHELGIFLAHVHGILLHTLAYFGIRSGLFRTCFENRRGLFCAQIWIIEDVCRWRKLVQIWIFDLAGLDELTFLAALCSASTFLASTFVPQEALGYFLVICICQASAQATVRDDRVERDLLFLGRHLLGLVDGKYIIITLTRI